MIKTSLIFSASISLRFFVFSLFFFPSIGSQAQSFDMEQHIGLYQVTGSKCNVNTGEFDPCKSTHFIEIVKGQFIGIKNTELAYVFWSGDFKIDPELQYEAHLIKTKLAEKVDNNKFFLNADHEEQEYFTFANNQLTAYTAKYIVGKQKQTREIHYLLKKVERGNLPLVRLNYPGNQ